MTKGINLANCEKKRGKYYYRNRWWIPNEPVKSTRKDKKMMVMAVKMVRSQPYGKIIHFGGNKWNPFTQNDKWSATYWSSYWANQAFWSKHKNRKHGKKAA